MSRGGVINLPYGQFAPNQAQGELAAFFVRKMQRLQADNILAECAAQSEDVTDSGKKNSRRLRRKWKGSGDRRQSRGALSLVALVAGERKPPHVPAGTTHNITGLILNPNNSRIAAKRWHYNTGGYMTLAELGMAFGTYSQRLPVIAGISCQYDCELLNKRKTTCHVGGGCRSGSCAASGCRG
ncbi:hypothetical protein ACNKHU_22050 [Shigella flexneri]